MIAAIRRHFAVLRLPRWGFDFGEARYYGWWGFIEIGPFAIYFGNVGPELKKCMGCLDHPRKRQPCSNHPNCRDREVPF